MFKVKAARPLFTGVITTAKKYVGEQTARKGGVIIDTRKMDGSLNPYQTVVSVGGTVRDVKEGEIVKINFSRYQVVKHVPGEVDEAEKKQYMNQNWDVEVPIIIIDDIEYLFIQDRDIEYVITDYEVDEGGLLQ